MKKILSILLLSILLLPSLYSCSKKISRIDPNSTIDLSGKWNDVDSRIVANSMIKKCLNSKWISRYDDPPTLIVGEILNKSHEHINTAIFIKDIEREFLESGEVNFVANKSERLRLREEVTDQEINASKETRKSLGQEYAADLMLLGSISTIIDKEGNKAIKFYQVDLEVIELATNRKKWIGTKKIKKIVKSSIFTF